MRKDIRVVVVNLLLSFLLVGLAVADKAIPEKKQTNLGLYVNSVKAYQLWRQSPEKVAIIDCRTPEEYNFVGHAPMACNIPSQFMTYQWDKKKKAYKMKPNPDFVAQVKARFTSDRTLLVMCRSGHRSAEAANQLAAAGYRNVYTIYDGFEGDKVRDDNSYFKGRRMINGWKNSGNPWTFDNESELVYTTAP